MPGSQSQLVDAPKPPVITPTFPMDGKEFLQRFRKYLTEYELTEIGEYQTIYYMNKEGTTKERDKKSL